MKRFEHDARIPCDDHEQHAGGSLGCAPIGFPATDGTQGEAETGELLLRHAKFAANGFHVNILRHFGKRVKLGTCAALAVLNGLFKPYLRSVPASGTGKSGGRRARTGRL